MAHQEGQDEDNLRDNWLSGFEDQCLEDYDATETNMDDTVQRETEYSLQKLFSQFQNSATAIAQLYKGTVTTSSAVPFFFSCLSCGCQKPQPFVFSCRLPHLNNLNRGRSASSCETSLHYVPLQTLLVLFDQNNCHCIKQDYTWLTCDECIRTRPLLTSWECFDVTVRTLSRKKVRANELAECVNLTEIMDFKQEIRDFSYGTSPGEKI